VGLLGVGGTTQPVAVGTGDVGDGNVRNSVFVEGPPPQTEVDPSWLPSFRGSQSHPQHLLPRAPCRSDRGCRCGQRDLAAQVAHIGVGLGEIHCVVLAVVVVAYVALLGLADVDQFTVTDRDAENATVFTGRASKTPSSTVTCALWGWLM